MPLTSSVGDYFTDSIGHHYWHYAPTSVLHVLNTPVHGRQNAMLNILSLNELRTQLSMKEGDIRPSDQVTFDKTVQNVLAEMGLANKV